jgi:hypothetical protein
MCCGLKEIGWERFNGIREAREAVETAAVTPNALTPGWKAGVNERALGEFTYPD